MELVVDFVNQFIIDGLELTDYDGNTFFTLQDLENALDFALIGEGVLKSDRIFDYANILSVRLHSLVNSDYKEYFNYPEMVDKASYINNLL